MATTIPREAQSATHAEESVIGEGAHATTAHTSEASGIAALGVDSSFLLVQAVNFSVLLIILSLVLYRPVLALLKQRRESIEAGLSLAERTKRDAQLADQKTQELIASARQEARAIVEQARSQAEALAEETKARAATEATALLERTRAQLEAEKASILEEVEAELGSLVAEATRRVVERQENAVSEQEIRAALDETKGMTA